MAASPPGRRGRRPLRLAVLCLLPAEAQFQPWVDVQDEAWRNGATAAACPPGSPGAFEVETTWAEFCGEQDCGDWDYSSIACWGLNAGRCGWSCSSDAPPPTSEALTGRLPLQGRPRYGRGELLEVQHTGSALRLRLRASGGFVWAGNQTLELVGVHLRLPAASAKRRPAVIAVADAVLESDAVLEPDDSATCSDAPIGWADSSGDGCAKYEAQQWCSIDGSQGALWNAEWGDLSQYAHDGVAADAACCACGGGERWATNATNATTRTTTAGPAACVDDPEGWVDSGGDGCANYEDQQWCSIDGSEGALWNPEWGDLSQYANDGVAADVACCACGGGERSATNATTRTTTAGPAACVDDPEGWVDSSGDSCAKYEAQQWCSIDGSQGALWNAVWGDLSQYANDGVAADAACCACGGGERSATNATTRTTTAGPAACVDDPEGWVDSGGDSCSAYATNAWCTADGQAGENFGGTVADFGTFEQDGHTALTACCACGGGARGGGAATLETTAAPTSMTSGGPPGCLDEPEGWVDSDGDSCSEYATFSWCTTDGGAGEGFEGTVEDFRSFMHDGHTALTACCACGGGSGSAGGGSSGAPRPIAGSTATTSTATTSTAITTTTSTVCVDWPAGWVDSDGDDCGRYEAQRWCLPDGSAGPELAGDFDRFANDGHTASTACCACGGGERSAEPPPATTTAAPACVDDPEDWTDIDGASCATYQRSRWCTPDGRTGASFGGSVEDFGHGGRTALTACCACGGGARSRDAPPPQPTTARPGCRDDPEGWSDSDGDSCDKYGLNGWCTSDGRPGPSFGGTADDFRRFERGGRTALTACCVCGGGEQGVEPLTTTLPVTPQTSAAPATTAAGCTNDPEEWVDSEGHSCSVYAASAWCLPDGQPGQAFGSADNFTRLESGGRTALTACCACGGGAQRPPPTACVDDPRGWADADGDDCARYTANGWCTADGRPGAAFGGDVEDFDRFAAAGHTALTACCACGGGSGAGGDAVSLSPAPPCADDPEGWVDLSGDACSVYRRQGWCTADGRPGASFGGTADDFRLFENGGRTALTACCACGGGVAPGNVSSPATTPGPGPVCADEPTAWVDSDGDGCQEYQQNAWCTPDGQPGPDFGGDAHDFSRFEHHGHTAVTACCACGGGVHAGARGLATRTTTWATTRQPAAPPPCADDPMSWVDSEGDSCEQYEENLWCTPDGQPGSNFHGTLSDFSHFANQGRTALTACCACGGGERGGREATTPETTAASMSTTSARPATSARPTIARPTTSSAASQECADDPLSWVDSDGDDCKKYEKNRWCTADGQPGPNFEGSVEDFSRFEHDGHTALTACCACGGGQRQLTTTTTITTTQPATSSASPTTPGQQCVDDPDGWVDTDGDNCTEYTERQYCTAEGLPGPGFDGTVEDFSTFERNGHTALTACCACGGGKVVQTTTTTTTQPATSSASPTTPGQQCVDDPDGWVDADGDNCTEYKERQYCTADGLPGPGFDGTVEDFNTFERNGHTALTACCACSGGKAVQTTAPSATSHGTTAVLGASCTDDPEDWSDKDGAGCDHYVGQEWCTADGHAGSGWVVEWGTPENYGNGGRSAFDACCGCGGGRGGAAQVETTATATTTGTAAETADECHDKPEGWKDADGFGCDAYRDQEWCTAQGLPGRSWMASWGTLETTTDSNGVSSIKACCVCGGGDRGGRASKHSSGGSAPGAELHLVHADPRSGEHLVLVVALRPGGSDAGLLGRLGLVAATAPEAHTSKVLGAEVDLADVAAAIGGLGGARYLGSAAAPHCGAVVHRFSAARPLRASAAQLAALACALSASPPWARVGPKVVPRELPRGEEAGAFLKKLPFESLQKVVRAGQGVQTKVPPLRWKVPPTRSKMRWKMPASPWQVASASRQAALARWKIPPRKVAQPGRHSGGRRLAAAPPSLRGEGTVAAGVGKTVSPAARRKKIAGAEEAAVPRRKVPPMWRKVSSPLPAFQDGAGRQSARSAAPLRRKLPTRGLVEGGQPPRQKAAAALPPAEAALEVPRWAARAFLGRV